MNRLLLILFVVVCTHFVQAQEAEGHTLTIEITGLKSDKGAVFISLFNTEKAFLKKGIKSTKIPLQSTSCVAIFEGLPKGDYAVSLFHDENQNDKMDTKIFGIPKEPYGFSNNAKAVMGPPKFEDAKFSLTDHKTIVISLQ